MITKTFNAETEYDYDLDIYSIISSQDFEFGKSLEIEDGIILDFDKNNIPISIEILDISKRLKVSRDDLKLSKANMKVKCSKDLLEVCITFYIKIFQEEFSQSIDTKIANNFNIPEMEYATC